MIKVKLYKSGKIIEVTNNEAHGLIERGLGKVVTGYEHKAMRPQKSKRYFTKGVKRGSKRTSTNNER